jgi:hypothetical protein
VAETKSKRAKAKKEPSTEIVRDSTFSRAVVDKAIVLDLGRDLEIACLQAGPVLVGMSDKYQTPEKNHKTPKLQELDVLPVLTEVARIRLPWNSATSLALSILSIGVSKSLIEKSVLAEVIEAMNKVDGTIETDKA